MEFPADIWWKIINYVIGNNDHLNRENYFVSNNIFKNINIFGKSKTTDLFLFRRLCKSSKKSIDKYTERKYSKIKKEYHIIFKYNPLYFK